jgi:type 2 lantibiotic biosynthesis protein LanM
MTPTCTTATPTTPPPTAVSALWARALGIRERRGAGQVPRHAGLAARRLERWQAQPPFGTDTNLFARRLAADGLSADELGAILGEPTEQVAHRLGHLTNWAAPLTDALAAAAGSGPPDSADEAALGCADELAILSAVEPLVERARARVLAAATLLAGGTASPLFDPSTVVAQLGEVLPGRLFSMLARTVAFEMQTASQNGALDGDTSAARFQSFVAYLSAGGGLDLCQAYPVLGRQVVRCLDRWVEASIEFLTRLSHDLPSLGQTFGPDLGQVVAVGGGVSDPHHGGREVLIVTFSRDTARRVVYKPKPMAVDVHFQDLLGWLNAHGQQPPLRRLTVLDRGEYGWVEFVNADTCATAAQVSRFYQRQGSLLALLHVLAATDLHFENIIAAGEDPVVVDLEALFHPSLRAAQPANAFEQALTTMDNSVLAVGMLPQPMRLSPGTVGLDVSGLAATAGQLSPRGVPRWVGGASDEARVAYERVPLAAGQHRSTLDGQPVDVLSYAEPFVAGFRQTCTLLRGLRQELLADDGPLASFADDTVRLLLRPTVVYARLLNESFHPDLLRDGLERDRFFDRLWVAVPNQPRLVRAIVAEQEDLWQGDIPKFTTRPLSGDVRTSSGDSLDGIIEVPGLQVARARLAALSDADLEQQTWFVLAALGSLPGAPESASSASAATRRGCATPRRSAVRPPDASPADFLGAAHAVGRRLADLALVGADDATWLGLSSAGGGLSVVPLGADLYDGLPGVALFLAHLGRLSGDADATRLASKTVTRLRRQIDDGLAPLTTIGAFSGWGGLVYAYTQLAHLFDEDSLLQAARSIATDRLPGLIAIDDQLDVASGAAGCLASLLTLHAVAPSPEVAMLATACGERLLTTARRMAHGIGWSTPASSGTPLTGFAHGAAGIACSLARLSAVSGDQRFGAAAAAALTYERSTFSASAGNWPDLRLGQDPQRFMLAWCHGAPGIGLGRLSALPVLDDAAARADIDAALATMLARVPVSSDALCHGELGNLDLLLVAAERFREPGLRALARRRAADVLARAEQQPSGLRCATPYGLQSPGLMTGLAGIGYGLLRLAEPRRVPSVLSLDGCPQPDSNR